MAFSFLKQFSTSFTDKLFPSSSSSKETTTLFKKQATESISNCDLNLSKEKARPLRESFNEVPNFPKAPRNLREILQGDYDAMNGLLVDDRPLVFDDLEKDQVVRQTTPIRNSPHKRKNESMAESYIEEVDELEFCSMENDEDRLAARFNVHTKSFKQRECKICSETVNAMSAHSMLVHMGKHDREAIRWECERCDFRSQSEIKVTKHIHSLHKGQGSPIDRRIKKNLDKYWISLVKECFPTRKSVIKSHIEELTKKKGFHRQSSKSNRATIVSCMLCNEKMLSDRSRLFDHIAQHCWRRSYECTHCEAKFSARNQATDHLRRSHQKQAQLVEIIDRELIDVWRSMGEQCFPEETDKIEHCINQRFRLLKLQGVSRGLLD